MEKNYFQQLNDINVNGKTEKKNGLTYLSWAWAWAEVKKLFPDASYVIYENKDGWNYHTDGKTCWVKTGVTINGIEHIEYLPVMDYKNRSIPADAVTSFDVNKSIQRSLTKAVARHGLGLYIYAGEDLPESEEGSSVKTAIPYAQDGAPKCEGCGAYIMACKGKDGRLLKAQDIIAIAQKRYGKNLCCVCMKNESGS